MKKLALLLSTTVLAMVAFAQKPQLMYIGTLDKKLLVIDENKEDVVGEIQLGGIPRTTVLSPDRKKVHIFTTQMLLETVDLDSRKVVSSFSLADPRSRPRISANAPDRMLLGGGGNTRYSGLAIDPTGRYLYTTMRAAVKDIDEYHVDPPQFIMIDTQEKKIAKSWAFPADQNQGFGFEATYKVSADGKLLYVFQDDILIFDLATFKQVDKIALAQPPYPGASPYRLAANEDTMDEPNSATSVFTSVDPVVHRGTLGMASIELSTRKVDFVPIGPLLPMMGFQLSPDRKIGYSVMPKIGIGANRETEWWVWDIASHSVIKKKTFEARPTFRFGVGGDGKHLYLYGAGSSLEVWDAATLESKKLLFLKKDTTTNLITIRAAN
jgi:hypothetical protein